MNKVLEFFNLDQKINWRVEILAGLTVAMTMIPESLSFAILAGFPPLSGLYAAFIAGLVAAMFGGRPGLISGGAGATVVTLIGLIKLHGLEYAFAAVAMAGVFQIIVGVFKWTKYIRLVPASVMHGFVNGLAVIIFMAQLQQFKTDVDGEMQWLSGEPMMIMVGLVALTIIITYLLPRFFKAVPSSLMAIIVVFLLVLILSIDTKTVGDISPISGSLPLFHIPVVPLNLETLKIILPAGAIVAAVGLTEGLLTLNLVDEITETKGNGARSRVAGVVGALMILGIILVAAPIIEKIPMAALTGVMLVVSFLTFKWSSFRIINKMPKVDVWVMIIVTLITVVTHNLAVAVLIGIIISALHFTWQKANKLTASIYKTEKEKKYQIEGVFFFGSVPSFEQLFDVKNDPENIIIDFNNSTLKDMSALESLNKITSKYEDLGKKVQVINLDEDSEKMILRAGNLVKINIVKN